MAETGLNGVELEPTWDQKVALLNEALATRNIPYAFGGAIALNYHREPRSTLDIDINIFVPPEHEAGVLTTLGEVYDLTDHDRVANDLRAHGQARSLWGNTYIDLFLANTNFHASMAKRIQHQPFGDTTLPVLSIEDLLVCKTLYDRPKDWVDIEAVAQTRHGELDAPYINSWLGYFLPTNDPRITRVGKMLA